jgi:hypothetical protein
VQMATRLILEPIFEADFLDCSYGFRPGRSAHQALEEIRGHLRAGYQAVYDADLKSYFDSIPHSQLLACVRMRVVDRSVLRLIRRWLEAPVVEQSGEQGGSRKWSRPKKGTPQGGVATPLTQKVTSSSNRWSRAGEQSTRCLTFVLRGNMFMTYGALNQSGKDSAAECCSWATPAPYSIARGSAAFVTQVRSIRASSVPVFGGGVRAGSTGRTHRSYSADHTQASAEHGGAAAEMRAEQWPDHWSDRYSRVECVSTHPKKTWLSRASKAAHGKFTFPIRLIACSSQSSRKPTIFWCPLGNALSVGV